MPRDVGKRRERPAEDVILLNKIEEANPSSAVQFLEYLVLQRRSSVSLFLSKSYFSWPYFFLLGKGIKHEISQNMGSTNPILFEKRKHCKVMESKKCLQFIYFFIVI